MLNRFRIPVVDAPNIDYLFIATSRIVILDFDAVNVGVKTVSRVFVLDGAVQKRRELFRNQPALKKRSAGQVFQPVLRKLLQKKSKGLLGRQLIALATFPIIMPRRPFRFFMISA